MTTATTVRFGAHDLELGGKYLGELRESTALVGDPAGLRERMAADGYLFIRGLHRREHVLAARHELLERMAERGMLAPPSPVDEGVDSGFKTDGWHTEFSNGGTATRGPAVLGVVEGEPVMSFLDAPVRTFDFKWMRVVSNGDFTSAHLDNVYMGRGSTRLYTTWTPIGDTQMEKRATSEEMS